MVENDDANGRPAGATTQFPTRRSVLGVLGGSLLLAACSPTTAPRTTSPLLPAPLNPALTGDVLGGGQVKVALLLPRTAQGNAAALAASMRNAAELGLGDFVGNDLTVLVKDSGGTPATAAAAAQAAVSEGAEIILGPVFAAEVRGIAPVALAANVPVLAFSSDPSVAAPGVYIMGFLVDDQVRQVMSQASSAGRRSMAALISDTPYGTLAEAALREAAARHSVRLLRVERFAPSELTTKARNIATLGDQIDSVFVPDGPGVAAEAVAALGAAGLDTGRVTIYGSGVWNDPAIFTSPVLVGGQFPAPEIAGYQSFVGRYRAAYGDEPPLTATLAYDAVVLAAGLVRAAGPQRFQRSVLTNPEGFLSSINGLFRFNADGTNDRGLAVYEITGASPRLVQPAPRAFSGF